MRDDVLAGIRINHMNDELTNQTVINLKIVDAAAK